MSSQVTVEQILLANIATTLSQRKLPTEPPAEIIEELIK
jgi:hypothetical protein